MSRRHRVARLEAALPPDPNTLRCFDTWNFFRQDLEQSPPLLRPYLDLDAPPLALPILPFGGACPKSEGRDPLCDWCTVFAQRAWERIRRIAVNTTGLTEEEL